MQNLEIVTTADGSKTIFNASIGENYHSKHGALQESLHVFVGKGLLYYLENNPNAKSVSVLEVGFGTGLNFLLSAQYCIKQNVKLDYTGIEAFPLSNQLISLTEYKQYVDDYFWETFLAQYPNAITKTTSLNAFCTLTIAHTNLLDFKSEKLVDIIYFDAFAAIHQPQMWTLESISHTIKFLKPGGVFVTYAITGNLKRMLTTLGMLIEKVPGAANKREMLRAIKVR